MKAKTKTYQELIAMKLGVSTEDLLEAVSVINDLEPVSEEQLLNDEHILKRKKMFENKQKPACFECMYLDKGVCKKHPIDEKPKKIENVKLDINHGNPDLMEGQLYILEDRINDIVDYINSDHSE